MLTLLLLVVIGVLMYVIDKQRDEKRKLLVKIKKLEGDYSGELESIRRELSQVQLAGTNLERNLLILSEVGTLLDQLSLLKKQGAVNQPQTCLCLNAGHTPTKVLQTVLGMYGVIVGEDAIPEQIMEAAKGDHVELVILLKMFYGIEIKGVELQ